MKKEAWSEVMTYNHQTQGAYSKKWSDLFQYLVITYQNCKMLAFKCLVHGKKNIQFTSLEFVN